MFFQAEDGIRDLVRSRGLGDVYKRQAFWGPLAWSIIFGLSFATFLTLMFVPALYELDYVMKLKIARRKNLKRIKKLNKK